MAIKAKTKGLFSYRLREEKQAGSSRFEHYHDGYELTYFSKGNVTLFVKDGAIDARSGDLLLIRPREVHHLKYNESGYSRYILYFQPSFVEDCFIRSVMVGCSSSWRPAPHARRERTCGHAGS